MAKCSSCGENIHSSNNVCMYCGAEQKKQINEKVVALIFTIIIGVCFLSYIIFKPVNKEDKKQSQKTKELIELQVAAENTVKKMMKDPDSVKFKDQIGPCGYYSGKNSFGAYTGFKRYIVYQEMDALEGVNVDSENMNQLWNTACKY